MSVLKVSKNITSIKRLKPHWTLKSILLLIVVLSVLQIYFSNRFVTEGVRIQELVLEVQSVETANRDMKNHLQTISSLNYLEKKAQELGFEKGEKTEYLDPDFSLASR